MAYDVIVIGADPSGLLDGPRLATLTTAVERPRALCAEVGYLLAGTLDRMRDFFSPADLRALDYDAFALCDSVTCRWQMTHGVGVPTRHPIAIRRDAYRAGVAQSAAQMVSA